MAWNLEMTHLVLVNVNAKDGMAKVYSYFPFANGQCGRDFDPRNVQQIGLFDYTQIGRKGLN